MTNRTPEDARLRPQPGDKQHHQDHFAEVVAVEGRNVTYTVDGGAEHFVQDLGTWSWAVTGYRWEPAPGSAPAVDPLRAAYDRAVEAAVALRTALDGYLEHFPLGGGGAWTAPMVSSVGEGYVWAEDGDHDGLYEISEDGVQVYLNYQGSSILVPWEQAGTPEALAAYLEAERERRDEEAAQHAAAAQDRAMAERIRRDLVTLYGEEGATRALAAAAGVAK